MTPAIIMEDLTGFKKKRVHQMTHPQPSQTFVLR